MKNLSILLGLLITMLTSCAVLTETQLESVKQYAAATQEYADYPGILIRDYVAVQNDIFLLSSPLIADPDRAAGRVFSNQSSKKEILEEAGRLDLSFDILKEYAKNLEVLATADYFEGIGSSAEQIGMNLDTLVSTYNRKYDREIPVGIGGFVYSSFVFAGKKYLDRRRGMLLKEFITRGDTIIREIADFNKAFLEEKIAEEWISGLDESLKAAHAAVRRQILADTANYPSHTFSIIQLDTRVAEIYDEIYRMENLNEKLVVSIGDLYTAHHALNDNLQEKQKIGFILSEVSAFAGKVYELAELIDKL